MFLLVPAYPGCPGSKAVKRSLLLLFRKCIILIILLNGVVYVDRNAYKQGKKEKPPFVKSASPEPVAEDDDKKIPGELLCLICNNLLTDAVVIPCCGNSYCDDCKYQEWLCVEHGMTLL